MNYLISQEAEKEFIEIHELIRIAFQTANHADGDEHKYADKLRKSNNYIPELALTIKDNSEIVGHIMLTKTYIDHQSKKFEALLLSPICIKLKYRNQGLASKLIRHSLQKAKEYGYKAVFLVGEPDYYKRFGFRPIKDFGIEDFGSAPAEYKMGLELEENYLLSKGGTISIL
jgi:predicted N-acetyltransferase YhbS